MAHGVEPTVLVLSGSADSWHRRLQVGLLALGGRGWVSHEAAARLHGLDRAIEDAVEFSAPRDCVACPVVDRPHHGHRRPRRCAGGRRLPVRLGDAHDHRPGPRPHPDRAARRRPRAAAARQAARPCSGAAAGVPVRARPPADRQRRRVDARAALPPAGAGGRPAGAGDAGRAAPGRRHIGRVDFLFRAEGVVVEVTGRLGHSTPTERGRDAQRRNELSTSADVYEYTWAHVTDAGPGSCMGRRRLLRERPL